MDSVDAEGRSQLRDGASHPTGGGGGACTTAAELLPSTLGAVSKLRVRVQTETMLYHATPLPPTSLHPCHRLQRTDLAGVLS